MKDRRRALLLEPAFYGPESLGKLRASGVEWTAEACPDREGLVRALAAGHREGRPFTAIFARLGLGLDAEVFAAGGGAIRWIVTPTTGLSHIDVSEAEKLGIGILSLKGRTDFLKTIASTAELAWGLLLALIRTIPAAHADVLENRWRRDPFPGRELRGRTLGIVGLGRLGALMAGYARAFGMRVLACDLRDEVFADPANAHVERRSLEPLLSECDIVSLHLPLEEGTRGILDARRIGLMKRGAVLVNTARGELLDETDRKSVV